MSYWGKQLASVVGGTVVKAHGKSLTVKCVDGKTRRLRFQVDGENNPGTSGAGFFGSYPILKGTQYPSLKALETMKIESVGETSGNDGPGDTYQNEWPEIILSHPEDANNSQLLIAFDDEGNGPGWVDICDL